MEIVGQIKAVYQTVVKIRKEKIYNEEMKKLVKIINTVKFDTNEPMLLLKMPDWWDTTSIYCQQYRLACRMRAHHKMKLLDQEQIRLSHQHGKRLKVDKNTVQDVFNEDRLDEKKLLFVQDMNSANMMDGAYMEKQFKMFMKDIMVDQDLSADQFEKMKKQYIKHQINVHKEKEMAKRVKLTGVKEPPKKKRKMAVAIDGEE